MAGLTRSAFVVNGSVFFEQLRPLAVSRRAFAPEVLAGPQRDRRLSSTATAELPRHFALMRTWAFGKPVVTLWDWLRLRCDGWCAATFHAPLDRSVCPNQSAGRADSRRSRWLTGQQPFRPAALMLGHSV
jgi:hypothetical protein